MKKRILIVQFRTDQSEKHEQACYNKQLSDTGAELAFVNAVQQPLPAHIESDVAGIILGGSGEFYLSKDHGIGSWRHVAYAFIDLALKEHVPLLGVCFGFQMIALHQGARIDRNPDMEEVGAYEIRSVGEAAIDPLFSHIKSPFMAHLAHKETNVDFPDHVEVLAMSDRVEVQAFRVKQKPVWGVLFHAELDKEQMTERFYLYLDSGRGDYAMNGTEKTVDTFCDTPEATKVLTSFAAFALSHERPLDQINKVH